VHCSVAKSRTEQVEEEWMEIALAGSANSLPMILMLAYYNGGTVLV
jgi:hypothetical protein